MTSILNRYQSAERCLPWNAPKHIYNWWVKPNFIGISDRFWYRVRTRRGHEFIGVLPETRTRQPAFDHERLAAALTQATGQAQQPFALPFEVVLFDDDASAIRFDVGETTWRCDLHSYALSNAPKAQQQGELLSPDGNWAVYVQANNLWRRDMRTGECTPITTDGEPHFAYGLEAGGTMTGVSDDRVGTRKAPLAVWSPDSARLLMQRVDERAVQDMHLLQNVTNTDSLRPRLHTYKLQMPQDSAMSQTTYVIVNVAQVRITPVDIAPQRGMTYSPLYWAQAGMQRADYWSRDSQRLYIHCDDDSAFQITLYEVNPDTGASRILHSESAKTPMVLNVFRFNNPNYRVLEKERELIWFSERDGWAHLYLLDGITGELKNQITCGEWVVRDLLHVDEAARQIYFTAGGIVAEKHSVSDPYYRQLYRIHLDGSGLQCLSPEDAEHLITPSPTGNVFVDTYSRVNVPPITVLRNTAGRVLLKLEEADAADLLASGFRYPEPFKAKARDGTTDVYGVMFFPSDFDPQQSYPILDSIYGANQLTVVPKAFPICTGYPLTALDNALEEYWMPQATAELGFIVVVIDGMGTPYRSRPFHDRGFHDPLNGGGLADHVVAIRALAAQRPYLDVNRVGIFGHSGGGDNSAKGIFLYPDFFKVAVSSAGNHEMRAYASMSANQEVNAERSKLAQMSNSALAANLQGKLLLVTGDMDENCHPLHTLCVADALIKANKDFDLLVLPNRNHGFTLEPYFIRRRWDYFVRHLLNEEPPANYAIALGNVTAVL